MFSHKYVNSFGTKDFRIYLEDWQGKRVSFIDDVPLWANEKESIVNMVVEIPQHTNYKMEIAALEEDHPIMHDTKGKSLRFTNECYPFNYGAVPQTWENPNKIDPLIQLKGDGDPLDICEIGTRIHNSGDIIQVKILGAYAMIDEDEADWKIVGIDIRDHEYQKFLNEEFLKEEKDDILIHFLKYYKIKDGKRPSKFAFEGKLLNAETAMQVIKEAHSEWLTNN